jgi:RNA polymerase sigma-70 factor (ECF subfamily)
MDERENELVAATLAGDPRAFEVLISPYNRSLFSLAFRLTGDVEDAKEMVQEALLDAFKHLGQFDPQRSFRNWLFQILTNAARKLAAGRKRHEVLRSDSAVDDDIETTRQLDCRELRSRLIDCLEVLSTRERQVFLLRDIEGRDIRETSQILGCSSISVRVHLSSARKKIADQMRKRFPEMLKDVR